MTKKTKSLTAYNLYDFVKGVQDAVLEGYRLSEQNEHFPVQLGPSLYTGIMVFVENENTSGIAVLEDVTKEEPVVEVATNVAEKVAEVVVEDKPKGRTKKAAKE